MARGKKKQIKRANGTGCVRKLSGNRRKPYAVLITISRLFDEVANKNIQKQQYLGYYCTLEEAERALAEYVLNPYDIEASKITLQECYDIWSKKAFTTLSKSSINTYSNALRYCEPIKDMPFCQIKTLTMQDIVDSCTKTSSTKNTIKTLLNVLSEFAMKNDWISKNYAQYIEIEESEPTFERTVFTKSEIDYLWSNQEDDSCKLMLILLYSGLRVNELLKNTMENLNLEEKWIYVPKSLAKNNGSIRYVPIHNSILPILEDFASRPKQNTNNIITKQTGANFAYNNFATRDLKRMNEHFESVHRMHDTRHSFISTAHSCKLDELALKKIVGHSPKDITSRVYTHLTHENLLDEINKLHY